MPKCSALPQILALLGGVAFAACQWLVFAYAPVEATLGLAQKIFYIHLPMSLAAAPFLTSARPCGSLAG